MNFKKTVIFIVFFGFISADRPNDEWKASDFVLPGIGAAVAIGTAPVALAAAGFGAGGVALGSLAAGVQSAVYGGATTGAFSVAQSAGAAGLGMLGTTVSGIVGAGAGKAAKSYFDNGNEETPQN